MLEFTTREESKSIETKYNKASKLTIAMEGIGHTGSSGSDRIPEHMHACCFLRVVVADVRNLQTSTMIVTAPTSDVDALISYLKRSYSYLGAVNSASSCCRVLPPTARVIQHPVDRSTSH